MRFTTRIIAGYALLIGLVVAVLAQQLTVIRTLQRTHQAQAEINFRTALTALNALYNVEQVEEYAQKFLLIGDTAYGAHLAAMQDLYDRDVEEMDALARYEGEQIEIAKLSQMWGELSDALQTFADRSPLRRLHDFPPSLQDQIDRVKAQTHVVYDTIRRQIETTVQLSADRGEQAVRVFWMTSVIVVALSGAISFVVVRSISRRLQQLTDGTRALREGRYSYTLDVSGGDEFAQVARDFNTMSGRLGELDQLKKDFVAQVSHEMKSPLASIRDTMNLLREQTLGPLTKQQEHIITLLLQRTKRVSQLIANVLDVSRIEAGAMRYVSERRDLVPLIETAVMEASTMDRGKGLTFHLDLPDQVVAVSCDGSHLIRVVENLLDNAAKFSPHGGSVTVRLCTRSDLPEGLPASRRAHLAAGAQVAHAVLSVSDQGPGIDDASKERVFERFFQLKRGGKGTAQGVGLGLTICRSIVEDHGGAIWFEDNDGGGSKACVLLPAEPEAASDERSIRPTRSVL